MQEPPPPPKKEADIFIQKNLPGAAWELIGRIHDPTRQKFIYFKEHKRHLPRERRTKVLT